MASSILYNILQVFASICFIYFSIGVLYILVFSIASLFTYKGKSQTSNKQHKILVMIPAYKADNFILETAKNARNQNYPPDKFDVVVICDSMQNETVEKLKEVQVNPLVVSFENSNKAKSLNKCMDEMGDEYEIAVILDADNIVKPTFLSQINNGFNTGFKIVQGHRVAKNSETSFAILDAVSEEINNNIFRKGHRVLGASSSLIGSGMGLDYSIYKQYMKDIDAVGEDKEMEVKLLKDRLKIEYLEDALVYDEKTSEAQNFKKQRSRWIAAQTEYISAHFFRSIGLLFKEGNFDYFDKILQFTLLPRIMLLGILFVISILLLITETLFKITLTGFTQWELWSLLFIITVISLLIALPKSFYNKRTLKALFSIPYAFISILGSLTQLKKAKKHFIATDHKPTQN